MQGRKTSHMRILIHVLTQNSQQFWLNVAWSFKIHLHIISGENLGYSVCQYIMCLFLCKIFFSVYIICIYNLMQHVLSCEYTLHHNHCIYEYDVTLTKSFHYYRNETDLEVLISGQTVPFRYLGPPRDEHSLIFPICLYFSSLRLRHVRNRRKKPNLFSSYHKAF